MDLQACNGAWIAIQVRPRYELMTSDLLRYKGYETFVPTYRAERQWSDRRKELTRPLFMGYIFCRLSGKLQAPIMSSPGIIRIVGSRSDAAKIENHEIESLQRVIANRVSARPCSFLNVGDRVRILDGSLAGIEGILVRHKTRDRLVLSVTLVQRSIEIELQDVQLQALKNNN